ncbi:TonB-dependent receptor [Altererythrobacter sp. KTW20L]|uniref:TonB-dependent receptor n=1 Tax=Altererythrobacter sp. KTW20L TaxID=2942210 RepID=UPI0020C081AC|nr:TonB-dependent receptor [Altererythrobacter sp. KTW20L]MCL6250352.1 TonB-dependent receptor [Altererythrobacter sp. KTW20L]
MKSPLLASAAPLIVAALTAFPALAQDAVLDDENTIVVLGGGLEATPAVTAYSTVEVTRDQLVTAASGRLEDALSNVAGFQQFRRSDSRSSNPTAQGVTLRALGGNASSRALVLLDGVPMLDPFFGHVPLSALAPERLELIRVTRGGGSGPFGSGALAGTIELESAGADALGLFTGQVLANQREDTEISASLAPNVGNGFASLSGRWDRGQGFWTTPVDQRVPASVRAGYESWSVSGRLVQQLGGLEVQLRGLAFDDQRTLRFAGADNTSEGQDVSLRVVSRGPWQVDALAYAQWRNFSNVVISSNTFNRALDQKNTPAEGQGGKIEVRPPVGDVMTLRLGADWRRSEGNLFEDAYNAATGARTQERFAGGVNENFGFYAENDIELGALTLTGGLRADRYSIADGYYRAINAAGTVVTDNTFADRSDWEVTWRAGALVEANEAVTLRAAAYTGLRLPTLNELYRPFAVFPVTTQANAALRPERLRGYEAGIDFAVDPGLTFGVTVFDNKVKNAIANVTVANNLRERQNVDAVQSRGVEFSSSLQRGPWGVDASLALTDSEVRGSGAAANLTGNRPSQTPTFAGSLGASYTGTDGTRFAATLRHVSGQFEDDLETDLLPSATTVDLFGQIPVSGRLSAVARVENLFDETIITRNQGGSMDMGVPQTFWLGLRYGF